MTQHPNLLPGLAEDLELAQLMESSQALIAATQDAGGAYPAAPTFSAYRGYAWLRDGSFTAAAMSRCGDAGSAERFHDWVAAVLRRRAGQVSDIVELVAAGEPVPDELLLPTRFTFSGDDGTDPWWDFQTDGYGMWLWAMTTHCSRHGVPTDRWATAARTAVDYICALWDRPCYDWWEEHSEHRHPSTLAALAAGLRAAVDCVILDPDRAAKADKTAEDISRLVLSAGVTSGRAADPTAHHLAKWMGSEEVDASLAACMVPFRLVEPHSALGRATLDAIGRDLDVSGGVHRFRADVYYGGGQWLLLACLLGWNRAAAGDHDGAVRHLRWVAAHARDGGDLPEQVSDHLLHPGSQSEWASAGASQPHRSSGRTRCS